MKRTVLWMIGLILLTGCESYKLTGQVVSGPKSMVQIVEADDPRLAGPPIEGATIEVLIDPDKGSRKLLPSSLSDEQGRFEVPVDVPGAGVLEYEVLVVGRAAKKSPAQGTMPLPAKSRKVLVILADGQDRPVGSGDTINEARQQIEQYYPR